MRFTLNGKRYDTSKMDRLVDKQWGEISTGITLVGIWQTRKTKRVFVATDSVWQASDGGCIGTRVHEADDIEIARLADEYDISKLYALLPDDSE